MREEIKCSKLYWTRRMDSLRKQKNGAKDNLSFLVHCRCFESDQIIFAAGLSSKKPLTSKISGLSILVGPPGLEPGTKGFRFVQLSLLPGLCLHHSFRLRWVPSSLYTFKVIAHQAWLGVGICIAALSFRRL